MANAHQLGCLDVLVNLVVLGTLGYLVVLDYLVILDFLGYLVILDFLVILGNLVFLGFLGNLVYRASRHSSLTVHPSLLLTTSSLLPLPPYYLYHLTP